MSIRNLLVFGVSTVIIITSLFFGYVLVLKDKGKVSIVSCTSNINLSLSDSISPGPLINGILYANLDSDGGGLLELSGTVKWQGNTYPVAKRINIKHDFNRMRMDGLVTIRTVSSLSLEHDGSPKDIIEKYLVGAPDLPVRIIKIRRILDSGYVVSNLNSPVMICLDR